MVLSHKIKSNKERIRQAIVEKIKKISKFKRQHPHNKQVRAKFLYFKEPVGVGNYKFDKIDGDSPYHEERSYTVSWNAVSNKELMEMYQKIKNGETYCFFIEGEKKLGKQAWNKDSNNYVTV